MKNSKVTKVLVLALSLVLLIGSAICFSVSASESEETYTYEIPMINISHGASSAMLFAVDAPIEEATAGNVVVTYSYYLGAEKKTAVAAYSAEITADAKLEMPVFYTVGISPKDQGEEIVVEAHKASAPSDFEPLYYSTTIGKYLYSKLYRDGLIYSNDAKEQKLAKMYVAQIEYVSMAQDALWNVENPDSQRTLLNSLKYVAVKDGKIVATGNSHDLIAGDSVTVAYTGTGTAPSGWTVTTYDANGKATAVNVDGNNIPLTASAVLTPYVDPDVITFEDLSTGYYLPVDSDNKVIYSQNGASRMWGNSKGEIAQVVEYDGNKGLDLSSSLWLYPKNYDDETHNVSLLQMDINCVSMNETGSGSSEKLSFRVSDGTDAFKFVVEWRYYPYFDGFVIKVTDSVASQTVCNWTVIAEGVTSAKFNLKIEYLWADGALRVSVDDDVIYNGVISTYGNKVQRVNYEPASLNPNVIIDNIKQTTIYVDPAEFNK